MKLIVYFNNSDAFVNIPADRIEKIDEFVYAYRDGSPFGPLLVGIFDLGVVSAIYLSEAK